MKPNESRVYVTGILLSFVRYIPGKLDTQSQPRRHNNTQLLTTTHQVRNPQTSPTKPHSYAARRAKNITTIRQLYHETRQMHMTNEQTKTPLNPGINSNNNTWNDTKRYIDPITCSQVTNSGASCHKNASGHRGSSKLFSCTCHKIPHVGRINSSDQSIRSIHRINPSDQSIRSPFHYPLQHQSRRIPILSARSAPSTILVQSIWYEHTMLKLYFSPSAGG